MKKSFPANTQLITIALFYFLALPIVATAAITYTRSPSGVSATSPVTVTLSADSFAEFGMPPETLSYNIQIEEFEGALNFQGSCYLTSETATNSHFDLPPSLQVMQIYLIPFNTTNCTLGTEIAEYNLEGDGTGVVFAITGIGSATSLPPVSPKTTIPTTVLTPVTSTTQSAPLPNTISVSTNIAPKFNFMRDLYLGMVGDDVRMLQVWLNTHGYVLASSGAGSPGNETSYFGKLTQTALAKFQLATGISPTAGYFGPKTRGAISTR